MSSFWTRNGTHNTERLVETVSTEPNGESRYTQKLGQKRKTRIMSRRFTPQEKKRKSLSSDCRNIFGENDKSSRKAIRRHKAIVNRSFRRAAKKSLADSAADPVALYEGVNSIHRPKWKKVADKPLGEVLRKDLNESISKLVRNGLNSNPQILELCESQLIDSGMPDPFVQDVMAQIRDDTLGHFYTRLNMDYETASIILSILKRIVVE